MKTIILTLTIVALFSTCKHKAQCHCTTTYADNKTSSTMETYSISKTKAKNGPCANNNISNRDEQTTQTNNTISRTCDVISL